jgi:cell division protein FtsA
MSAAPAAGMAWEQIVHARPAGRAGSVAVLDIGTSKVCCFIGRVRPGRGFVLQGRGYQVADGLKGGEIVDAEAADAALRAVLQEAEQQADETLREVVVTLSGGRPSSRLVRVEGLLASRPIGDEDLRHLMERARQEVAIEGRAVLHVLPIEVSVDGGRPLRDPRGLLGERMEMLTHVVSVAVQPLHNILAAVDRCHLEVKSVQVASYAAGIGCLTEDEMDRGCLVIDMGGGTTDVALFVGGRLAWVDQVPYGGEHVTGDIAYVLKTGRVHAERIKNLYGAVQWRSCDDSERIVVPLIGDHVDLPTGEIARTSLTQIIRARVEEILQMIQKRMSETPDLQELRPARSVVLTGGASQIEGADELAQEMFGLPTRLGRPNMVHGVDGAEDEACCAAVSGALALAGGSDGGLGWSETIEVPGVTRRIRDIGRWFLQNF